MMKRLIPVLLILILVSAPVYGDDLKEGLEAYKRKDYAFALEKLRPLAKKGHAEAQFKFGVMYYYGEGVSEDYREAVKWFKLSAEQGFTDALHSLGASYLHGHGVPRNYREALRLFILSAEQGHWTAPSVLGSMYDEGKGVPQDYVLAHKWFNVASAIGFPFARDSRDKVQRLMTPDQIAEAQKLAREWMEEHGRE